MELIIDLFAGGGGASHGIYKATGRHPDAAVNHDPVAVAVHSANHPTTKHYCQDVWTVHPAWVSRGRRGRKRGRDFQQRRERGGVGARKRVGLWNCSTGKNSPNVSM